MILFIVDDRFEGAELLKRLQAKADLSRTSRRIASSGVSAPAMLPPGKVHCRRPTCCAPGEWHPRVGSRIGRKGPRPHKKPVELEPRINQLDDILLPMLHPTCRAPLPRRAEASLGVLLWDQLSTAMSTIVNISQKGTW